MTAPPEVQRLQDVIQDLKGASETLPRGITHHTEVLRRHFYGLVFEGEWDGPIEGPEGEKMTKHNGCFISLKALRNQLLEDIEELIAAIKTPVAETTGFAVNRRTPKVKAAEEDQTCGRCNEEKEPFVRHYLPGISSRGYHYTAHKEQYSPPRQDSPKVELDQTNTQRSFLEMQLKEASSTHIRDQNPSMFAFQPFSEQIRAIEGRAPYLGQVRGVDVGKGQSSDALGVSLSGETSHNKVRDMSTMYGASGSPPFNTTTNYQLVATDTSGHPRMSIIEASWASKGMMADVRQSIVDDLHRQQAQRDQVNPISQLPTQQPEERPIQPNPIERRDPWVSGPGPGSMEFRTAEPSMGARGYEAESHGALPQGGNPSHYVSQPMQYRYMPAPYDSHHHLSGGLWPPGQDVPVQALNPNQQSIQRYLNRDPTPAPGWLGTNTPQPNFARQFVPYGLSSTTPIQAGTYTSANTRPPSSNRVAAQVYRNDPAFHYGGLPQVRGTPVVSTPQGRVTPATPAPQVHGTPSVAAQLQSRFGVVPPSRQTASILSYRPGADVMRPHAFPYTHSTTYENLTRNTLPTVIEAQAEENLPFAQVAKESQAPNWGVLRIGNVSIESETFSQDQSEDVTFHESSL